MTYVSSAAKDDLSDELSKFVSPSITRSDRRAVAKEADQGVTATQLDDEPVSVLPEVLELYEQADSETVARVLVALTEEHTQAVIDARGVDVFRSEIYGSEGRLATNIDPWALRGLQAVAEEKPAEVLEDLPALAQLLKLYPKSDRSHEREIYSSVRLLNAIGREYPDQILTVDPDPIKSIVEVLETVETTFTLVYGLITLKNIAGATHAGRRRVDKFAAQVQPLLWDNDPDIRYQACRLAVNIDFDDVEDRLEELIRPVPLDASSPAESRIPLAASRALAASRGDQETAERAERLSLPLQGMHIDAVSNKELLRALGDPDPIIRRHAAATMCLMSWRANNMDFLAAEFPELVRQQDDPVPDIRGALTLLIGEVVATSGTDLCSLKDVDDERFETALENVIPLLDGTHSHPRYIKQAIGFLGSMTVGRPAVVTAWLRASETPSVATIIDRSIDNPQLAGSATFFLWKLTTPDLELVAEQGDDFIDLAKALTPDVTYANKFYDLIIELIEAEALDDETLDQLVSPIAGLVRADNRSSDRFRLQGCRALCYLAADLDDPAILPTIYEMITDTRTSRLNSDRWSKEAKYVLDGLQAIADQGFVPPDEVIEKVIYLTQSEVEIDDSSIQAETIGELAVATLGAIEDESINGHLRELQSMDDLPIETRRAATRALQEQ